MKRRKADTVEPDSLSNKHQKQEEDTGIGTAESRGRSRVDSSATKGQALGRTEEQSHSPNIDFWTKRPSIYRSQSRGSRSSSINDQLHWSQVIDTTYQSSEASAISNVRQSSADSHSSRGLFAAPVKWHNAHTIGTKKEQLSFDCEICGQTVHVKRRRDWQ